MSFPLTSSMKINDVPIKIRHKDEFHTRNLMYSEFPIPCLMKPEGICPTCISKPPMPQLMVNQRNTRALGSGSQV
jgi:hypothetical protein